MQVKTDEHLMQVKTNVLPLIQLVRCPSWPHRWIGQQSFCIVCTLVAPYCIHSESLYRIAMQRFRREAWHLSSANLSSCSVPDSISSFICTVRLRSTWLCLLWSCTAVCWQRMPSRRLWGTTRRRGQQPWQRRELRQSLLLSLLEIMVSRLVVHMAPSCCTSSFPMLRIHVKHGKDEGEGGGTGLYTTKLLQCTDCPLFCGVHLPTR